MANRYRDSDDFLPTNRVFFICIILFSIDFTGFLLSNWEKYLVGNVSNGVVPCRLFHILFPLQLVATLVILRAKRKNIELAVKNEGDAEKVVIAFILFVEIVAIFITLLLYYKGGLQLNFEVIYNSPPQIIVWWCFIARILLPLYLVLLLVIGVIGYFLYWTLVE